MTAARAVRPLRRAGRTAQRAGRRGLCGLTMLVLPLLTGCDRILPQRTDVALPPIENVRGIFVRHGVDATVTFRGNVVELFAVQPMQQLEQGGSLWARVGPYIYLFTPATREIFDTYDGIAAVRAVTTTHDGEEIARALLLRDRFGPQAWQRTHRLLGLALRDGTERPVEIERLAHWGELHTEHSYNPRYTRRAVQR